MTTVVFEMVGQPGGLHRVRSEEDQHSSGGQMSYKEDETEQKQLSKGRHKTFKGKVRVPD